MKKKKPLKIVLIGDSGCGKTSLILSYIGLPMSDEHTPTAFDDFVTDAVMADGKEESLIISDTAGSDDYSSLRPLSYPDADVFMVCYAVDSKNSLDNAKGRWIEEASKLLHALIGSPTLGSLQIRHFSNRIPTIFVGTKKDMRYELSETDNSEEIVDFAAAEQVAGDHSEYPVLECSAKTKESVRIVFETAILAAHTFRNRQKSKVLQQLMKLKLVF